MRRKRKTRQAKSRLMAVIFCVSLFFADLATVVPVWAQEPAPTATAEVSDSQTDMEERQEAGQTDNTDEEDGAGEDHGQDGENGTDGEQDPAAGNDSQDTPDPDGTEDADGEDPAEDTPDLGAGDSDSDETDSETGDVNSGDEENAGEEQDPDEAEPEDSAENAGEEENEAEDTEKVASISANELEEQDDLRTMMASGDNIASGTYENITWVLDADGKLTVTGEGDYVSSSSTGYKRVPWYSKRAYVKSAEVKVTGMTDASYMFYGCYNMTSVTFDGSDTTMLKNMSHMFDGCFSSKLNIDLSGVRTDSVMNMSHTFDGCSGITHLDLSGFNTESVTDMSSMFFNCHDLESIDFGQNFDTGNVMDMGSMFRNCNVLKGIEKDLRRFNTKNVTDMSFMLYQCLCIDQLDLSSWDTSKVTDMHSMFRQCGFSKITLGGSFTTHNVTDMSYMFACRIDSLTESYLNNENRLNLNGLDLGWLDLSSVEHTTAAPLYGIFCGCNVKQLDLSRLDTGVTTTLAGLFASCDMTGVDFSDLRTDTITDMSRMFSNCKGTIDLRTLNTENVTDMSHMFTCISGGVGADETKNRLTSLDLSGLNTENVTDMSGMFQFQDELTDLDISVLNTGNVTDMGCMFWGCCNLTSLDFSSLDTGSVTSMGYMFCACTKLTDLNLGNLGSGNLQMLISDDESHSPCENMFSDCKSLKAIDMSKFNFENITSTGLFSQCDSLTTIRTPYNVKVDQSLPEGTWYMMDGTTTTVFPKNLTYSVLLKKGEKPTASAERIEVSKKKTVYACGETVDTQDLTVIYYGTDGTARKLAEGEYTTNAADINTSVPGKQILTVKYQKDGTPLEAQVTLTIILGLTPETTEITLPEDYNYTYDGQTKMPVPVVNYNGLSAEGSGTKILLEEGNDYTVSYRYNVNARESSQQNAPTVVIKGIGDYSGTVTKTFTIKKAPAPVAEEQNITASQCAQARPNRTADLSDSFAACGKKTGYEITNVNDPSGIFSKTPVSADIRNGILTYSTAAAQEGSTASITVNVAFANYENAELTVKITMVAKKGVVISGIEIPENTVYNGSAVSYSGTPSVKAEDGTDLTKQVTLVYSYSGTMADGTAYPAAGSPADAAPVNAGSYRLTVAVQDDDSDYAGSSVYPFTISPAAVTVKANDLVLLTEEGQNVLKPVSELPFRYDARGLVNEDKLITEPTFAVTDRNGQPVMQIDVTKEENYYIVPSGADAGMNYEIAANAYEKGTLMVMDERVAYTVDFDGMGHTGDFVKSGIKAGSLLELTKEERAPKADGYLFAGWYRDKTFSPKSAWDFEKDIVQENMTLYACWLTGSEVGLKLFVQEIPDLVYTGNAQKPAVTVYDSDGKTLLKAGRDYTVKYVRNTDAVAIGQDGQPMQTGGTAKVKNPGKANESRTNMIGEFSKECPYVIITGKGNYSETIYQNFRILPADISEGEDTAGWKDTALADGFTLKYTDQFEAKADKSAKIISSFKYKKALKADKDYAVSVQDKAGKEIALTQGKLPLDAGAYKLTITGKGNYTGTVARTLYVAEKLKLMKNASVTYAKTIKATSAAELSEGIRQTDIIVKIGGNEVPESGYEVTYAGNHAVGTATMILTGKNENGTGYVGSKSVTFKITGAAFSARTIEVKTYDVSRDEKDWKASMPYTGRAVTQNKVSLTVKASGAGLIYGEDYTITYKNNVKKGTAIMIFTAKPESGFSGSFKKNFKITQQNLSADMFVKELPDGSYGKQKLEVTDRNENKHSITVKWDEDAVHSKNGAALSFALENGEGIRLKAGTDYTVSYKYHKAATKENAGSAVKAGSKQPVMTIKGKGNYTGTLIVQFQIIPASIASDHLTVTATQVKKKNGMKFKDFKVKVTDGKTALKAGVDYTVDESGCTPEIIAAYASSLETGQAAVEPKVALKGIGNYGLKDGSGTEIVREISLADYIYTTKFTTKNLKVEVTGNRIYTGQNIEPSIKVSYYKDNNAGREGASGTELKEGADYKITYGTKNIRAGKKTGSVTVTGVGIYGGSVTVKFDIEKKAIY